MTHLYPDVFVEGEFHSLECEVWPTLFKVTVCDIMSSLEVTVLHCMHITAIVSSCVDTISGAAMWDLPQAKPIIMRLVSPFNYNKLNTAY